MASFAFLPLCLLFLGAQGLFAKPAAVETQPPKEDDGIDSVKLRLYGNSLNEYEEFRLSTEADNLPKSKLFSPEKLTALYVHGYTESPDSESVKTVISALMGISKYNLIAVDWSKIAAKFYLIPALQTPEVGKAVARRLDEWHRSGDIPMSNVYIIGHSLGGQVAGFIGKNVKEDKIPRITGLDPAYPGFYLSRLKSSRLSEQDALFVDVIHTDGGLFGVPYNTAHVDFYPNGGRRNQPGCPASAKPLTEDDFCSHWRSWRFFAESLNNALPPYQAVSCPSQEDFDAGKCDGNSRALMGFYTPLTTRGNFFLETMDSAPFSKSAAGLVSTKRSAGKDMTTSPSPSSSSSSSASA